MQPGRDEKQVTDNDKSRAQGQGSI